MKNKLVLIWLSLVILSFSAYEVVSKTVVGYIDPTQLTFVRYFIGGLCLLPVAIYDLRKHALRMTGRDVLVMILLGALIVAFSMNLIQIGYEYTNANISAVIISANPIFVAVLAAMILKEQLSWKKILGLSIGICGILVALGNSNMLSADGMFYGIMLQVIGMLAFSLYTVCGKQTAQRLGSPALTAFTNLFGSIVLLPFVLAEGIAPFAFELGPIWSQMLYICIGNTALAFLLYFKALQSLDTSLGAMAFLIKPLLASLLAALFLGEALTMQLGIGIVFVSAGIFIVMHATRKNNKTNLYKSAS